MGYRGVIDIKYLFENDIPAFSEADDYSGILEFAFPQNVVPHYEHDNGEDVLFYDIDGDYIYAAFMQAYHIDLISTDMHWHKFLALMNGLPDSTRLSAIMGYRAYTGEKIKMRHRCTVHSKMPGCLHMRRQRKKKLQMKSLRNTSEDR